MVGEVCPFIGPGCSIGPEGSRSIGTLCCPLVVIMQDHTSRKYGLTAAHVLGDNISRVIQPGTLSDPIDPRRQIGTYNQLSVRDYRVDDDGVCLQPRQHGDQQCDYLRDWALFEIDRGVRVTNRV